MDKQELTENELIERYVKHNCQKSFNTLYWRFNKYIASFLKVKYTDSCDLYKDLKQELDIEFMNCLNLYDSTRKLKFITYLGYRLWGARSNFMKSKRNKKINDCIYGKNIGIAFWSDMSHNPELIAIISHITSEQLHNMVHYKHKRDARKRLNNIINKKSKKSKLDRIPQ